MFQRREARGPDVEGQAGRVTATHAVLASTLVMLLALAFVGGVLLARTGPGEQARSDPYVGSDLHMLNIVDGRIYVGGHDGAAVRSTGPASWTTLGSLTGRDSMAVAETERGILIASHQGLYGSNGANDIITPVGVEGFFMDIHAVG